MSRNRMYLKELADLAKDMLDELEQCWEGEIGEYNETATALGGGRVMETSKDVESVKSLLLKRIDYLESEIGNGL